MPRDRDQIEEALKKKGFRREDSHHRYYKYYDGGRYTGVYTYLSMGGNYKVYSDDLLAKMKKTLSLDTNKQVRDLIDCPMTEKDFKKILSDKKKL